jgi:hypothetical protein
MADTRKAPKAGRPTAEDLRRQLVEARTEEARLLVVVAEAAKELRALRHKLGLARRSAAKAERAFKAMIGSTR